MFSASFRCDNQSSCQQGRGRGEELEFNVPFGSVVIYFFSEVNGGRGIGATRRSAAYSYVFHQL